MLVFLSIVCPQLSFFSLSVKIGPSVSHIYSWQYSYEPINFNWFNPESILWMANVTIGQSFGKRNLKTDWSNDMVVRNYQKILIPKKNTIFKSNCRYEKNGSMSPRNYPRDGEFLPILQFYSLNCFIPIQIMKTSTHFAGAIRVLPKKRTNTQGTTHELLLLNSRGKNRVVTKGVRNCGEKKWYY